MLRGKPRHRLPRTNHRGRQTKHAGAHGHVGGLSLDHPRAHLEAHPGQGFKVGELCKLIDATNEGSEVAKASPGALKVLVSRL